MIKVLNIAHRGASGYAPENTIEAFLKAAELGADMVEMDIHQTPEGNLIVTHDYPLKTAVSVLATLQEVITALYKKKIRLNIELKAGNKRYPNIEEKVLTILKRASLLRRAFISSFESYCIERLRYLNKNISLGIIFADENYREALKKAGSLNVDVLVTNKEYVTTAKIAEIHKAGFKLYAYTVNEISHMRDLIGMGIDGLYTDYPDRLREIIKTQKSYHLHELDESHES